MKKITLLFAFAFLTLTSVAQISEDFDDGMLPDGWSLVAVEGNCNWQFGADLPIGDDFPDGGIFFNDDGCGADGPPSIVRIQTAQYDLSNTTSAILTFDAGFQEVSGGETFTIEVYDEDADASVAVLQTFDDDFDPDIQTFTYDITEYIAANTSFRFTYDDNGAWGWYAAINTFTVDFVLATEDNQITGFKMFPNPANNELNLTASSNIEKVTVMNLLGQIVLDQNVDATTSTIDVSRLSTGAYLMQVASEGQLGTYKFVKQ